jgi:photosystem II stability/assembly factor-like uncharacterized protein
VVRATLALVGLALTLIGGADRRPPTTLVVLAGRYSRLLLSTNGRAWRDVTPAPRLFRIDDVQFLDSRHGFVAAGSCAGAVEALYRTSDAGRTWRRVSALQQHSCNAGATTTISFVDAQRGWSTEVEPTAGFAGRLVQTIDGGRSWKPIRRELPLAGGVRFRTARQGWLTDVFRLAGSLLETRDGGRSFRERRVPRPAGIHGRPAYESPVFFGRLGVLATRWGRAAGPRDSSGADAFYRTSNGGRTWRLASTLPLNPMTNLKVVSPTVWWIASHDAIHITTSGGRRWERHVLSPDLRSRSGMWLTPLDARTAVLAIYREPNRIRWFITHDGGQTFARFTP